MDTEQIRRLANELMTHHGVGSLSFDFHRDGAWNKKGNCQFVQINKVILPKRITLSLWWSEVMQPHDIRETLLHEIAHAKAGLEAAHGPLWAEQCRAVGIQPVEKKRASVSLVDKVSLIRKHAAWNGLDRSVSDLLARVE